jgi:hypothetical protein
MGPAIQFVNNAVKTDLMGVFYRKELFKNKLYFLIIMCHDLEHDNNRPDAHSI